MPLVLLGVKIDRSWLAVPDASGASNRVWCWTSSRPRPWGDPPPKRRRLLRGMQKPTWAAPWPSPTPTRALIHEGASNPIGPQEQADSDPSPRSWMKLVPTWRGTAKARACGPRPPTHRSPPQSWPEHPDQPPSPASCNWLSSPRSMSNPSEANSELASETGAVMKDFAPLPEVFRKAVPPRGGRGGPPARVCA